MGSIVFDKFRHDVMGSWRVFDISRERRESVVEELRRMRKEANKCVLYFPALRWSVE